MPAPNVIPVAKLKRLIGLPHAPVVLDIRAEAPRLLPASIPWPGAAGEPPAAARSAHVVISCEVGGAASHAAAARLRSDGQSAEVLEGGISAWLGEGWPLVPADALPPRDVLGRTSWVTRARPKVDRIACPWLIRRFVDPAARFLFVPPADVPAVAAKADAAPFDIEGSGVRWSHIGDACTFDAMVEGFDLGGIDGLGRLAAIVRGADTGALNTAPEAAGLLAASLGLSRMFDDDNAQLEAGLLLYDALYRWSRDATGETHNWQSHLPPTARGTSRS